MFFGGLSFDILLTASKNIGIKNKNYSENKCTVGFQIVNIQTTIIRTLFSRGPIIFAV